MQPKLASWLDTYGTRGLRLLVHKHMRSTTPNKRELRREIETALEGLAEALREERDCDKSATPVA